ncbi:MAG: APC family permease [Terriglobales bacterium]
MKKSTSGTLRKSHTGPGASGKKDADHSMNMWSVAAMGVGAMVGAGIFALLGLVGLVAGNETYISFLLGGVVAVLSGYTYAKLEARYPDAGGLTAYFHQAFGTGRTSATLSLTYLITVAVTIAMVAKAFGAYATPLAFGNTSPLWANAFASAITILLVLLNIADSSLVGKAEVVLVGIKLAILALLMSAGTYGMMGHPLVKHATPHFLSLIGSVGLTFFAYAGFGMMTNAAGRVSRPKQTIPRAIYLAIAVVILLYAALAVIVLGSVSSADLKLHADTAVAVAAKPVLGQAGYIIVSVAALLATASGINAWVFTAMQISHAMVQVGNLPRMFSHFVWRKGTLGLLLSVAAILLAINVLDLTALARIASATFLFSYLAVQIAHWRLIDETKGSRFLVGLGLLFITGVLACFLWSTFQVQPWSLGLIVAFVVIGWFIEFFLARSKAGLRVEHGAT